MYDFYTQEDIDYSLKNYTFKSLKNNSKYMKENYIKVYIFDIPKGIFDIFNPYFHGEFNVTKKKDNCGFMSSGSLTTRIDKKTNRVIPILICKKAIMLEPGNSMIENKDEAKEVLMNTYQVFEEKFDRVRNEKHQKDYHNVVEIIRKLSKERVEENNEIKTLRKKEIDLYKKADLIRKKINSIYKDLDDEKCLEVSEEIKNNDYKIPEEEVERFLCTTVYFEKSAIIQAVTENIVRITESDSEK